MKPKIILTGGTGLMAQFLANYFADNYTIYLLSRKHKIDSKNIKYIKWNGENLKQTWTRHLENAFAVINLAGKSVDCRYTTENKQQIYDSRIKSTFAIGQAIKKCKKPPKVWINASTATIYQNSYTPQTENSKQIGGDFSMDVAQKWEEECNAHTTTDTRKIILRTSIVLSEKGGALTPLKSLIKLGFGGKQGNGNQMVSWVSEIDVCRAIDFLLQKEKLEGIFNLSTPKPIPNHIFMKQLRKKYNTPFGIPISKLLLKIGEKIIQTESELILKSRFVLPERLLNNGFQFKIDSIDKL